VKRENENETIKDRERPNGQVYNLGVALSQCSHRLEAEKGGRLSINYVQVTQRSSQARRADQFGDTKGLYNGLPAIFSRRAMMCLP